MPRLRAYYFVVLYGILENTGNKILQNTLLLLYIWKLDHVDLLKKKLLG